MSSETKTIPKRIFMTGATGYIGGVITEYALAQGYTVHGLSRNQDGDAKVKRLGAIPVRGDLKSLDVLRTEAAQADIVLHLAFVHNLELDYEEILRNDAAAVDAMAEPLKGTSKPLVVTSGTLTVEPNPDGTETTEESPLLINPLIPRIRAEQHAIRLAEKGVRVSVIRLPPHVYGRAGKGFATMLMELAAKVGESYYIGDGNTQTSSVHVDDAAKLYLLVATEAGSGEVYNCAAPVHVTRKEFAEAMGAALDLSVRSIRLEEAQKQWGPLMTTVVQYDNRPSSRKAIEQLGWETEGVDILTDIRSGSYKLFAQQLRRLKFITAGYIYYKRYRLKL